MQKLKSILFSFIAIVLSFGSNAQTDCPEFGTPGAETCLETCIHCDLQGYQGSTVNYAAGPNIPGCPAVGAVNNDQWLAFIANSETISFVLTPSNCANGLQLALLSACDGQGIVCDGGSAGGGATATTITAVNLNIGQIYYLMVDGWDGAQCDFVVNYSPVNAILACENFSQVQGIAFLDFDCDTLQQSGELGMPYTIIRRVDTGNPISSTNASGSYNLSIPPSSSVEYAMDAPPGFSSMPITHQITSADTIEEVSGLNFALCPDSSFHNLKVTMGILGMPRPGFERNYKICLQNLGANTENAILTLDLSAFGQYVTFVDTDGGILTNGVLQWEINNLPIFETICFNVIIKLSVDTPFGTALMSEANVQILPTLLSEITYSDNLVNKVEEVVGSFDPNDKIVDKPNLTYTPNSGVTTLQYTIRFQNTGTAAATFVEVLDTLESKLDIRTLEMVIASHPYVLSFPYPNVIKWRFDDINLPDSSTNALASNGFVVFKISTKLPLNLGEMVKNKAAIFFDYNAPILTNTAVSSFTSSISNIENNDLTLSIAPNPAHDGISIKYTLIQNADSEIAIFNMQGLKVHSQKLGYQSPGDHSTPIQVSNLPKGLYIVQVRAGAYMGLGKVVVD